MQRLAEELRKNKPENIVEYEDGKTTLGEILDKGQLEPYSFNSTTSYDVSTFMTVQLLY
jgi:hypothetical protein